MRLHADYHKGAHDLELTPPLGLADSSAKAAGAAEAAGAAVGTQRLYVTEHDRVFSFDLTVPGAVDEIGGRLPIVPKQLCDDF